MKENDRNSPGNTEGEEPKPAEALKPAEYLRAVKAHLRGGKHKTAYSVLLQAVLHYPDEPLIVSYYGCLQAIVDKKHRTGVETCRKALAMVSAGTYGADVMYPVLYLNLGRAYVAAGKKKEAVDAFEKGLKYDRSHPDIKQEMRALGMRRRPPIPFLDRSNIINMYIGKLLHKGKKEPARKRTV